MEFKFKNSKTSFVDIEMLKQHYYNGKLKNQNIFARLFCLEENTVFKKESINKKIFINFDIDLKEWTYFITFLNNGFLPFMNSDNWEYILNDVNELCNKLGGIEEFDKYYKNIYKQKNKILEKEQIYNPLKPEDDIEKKYDWILLQDHFENIKNDYPDYQPIYHYRLNSSITDWLWLRKLI